jgi:hypothetical protein
MSTSNCFVGLDHLMHILRAEYSIPGNAHLQKWHIIHRPWKLMAQIPKKPGIAIANREAAFGLKFRKFTCHRLCWCVPENNNKAEGRQTL